MKEFRYGLGMLLFFATVLLVPQAQADVPFAVADMRPIFRSEQFPIVQNVQLKLIKPGDILDQDSVVSYDLAEPTEIVLEYDLDLAAPVPGEFHLPMEQPHVSNHYRETQRFFIVDRFFDDCGVAHFVGEGADDRFPTIEIHLEDNSFVDPDGPCDGVAQASWNVAVRQSVAEHQMEVLNLSGEPKRLD